MTLEEAIQHCEEVAASKCDACGDEHEQLAAWLRELRWRREAMDFARQYCNKMAEKFRWKNGKE